MSSIENAEAKKPPQVFISVTRLRLKSPMYLPVFTWNNILIIWQTINTPGFFSGKLLQDANHTFWTITAWDEQAAMKIFRNSGKHRTVMPKIQNWCDEASVVHWRQTETHLPDWVEIHQRLITDGFLTKLTHPSQAHLERTIPAPTATKALPLRPLSTKTPLIVKA